MTPQELEAILNGTHGDPFSRAGTASRSRTAGRCARFFRRPWTPGRAAGRRAASHAQSALRRILRRHARAAIRAHYKLHLTLWNGATADIEDPYRFPPLISDFDLHIHGEGTQYESYRTMGAHLVECQGVPGVRFAVWAPNAEVVSVVGDFNDWDERRHPMRVRTGGVWEIFLPGVGPGTNYKYSVRAPSRGFRQQKADPYGFATEVPPQVRLHRVRSRNAISGTTSSGWKRARTKII